nr:phosphodiester glycosidase family protein [uncultured Shimia sp.]
MMRTAAICVAVWSALVVLVTPAAKAVTCETLTFEGGDYSVCSVDLRQDDLRIFLRDETGMPLGSFGNVARTLPDGHVLAFGVNGGMYHADRRPVGLFIEDGQQEMRLLTNASPGNFGLLPNGVFCIRASRADVIETLRFADTHPDCQYATQSGPMLVIDDKLHPRFLKDGTSRLIRNGVGTTPDGKTAIFAMSNQGVNFHTFARLFRDKLSTPNALYLDGRISRLYAPMIGRADAGLPMGPIIGVVKTP